MADLNNISVIGHTTREIGEKDFSYTTNGKAKLNLSIAVNDGYGENKSVSYFDVTYWGKPAEAIKPYITKGKQLAIDGRLKQDRWEKDGNKYSRIYIVANNIQLLGGNSDGGQQSAPAQSDGGFTEGESSDFPEDVPF
jgi:single-strand DNA-binding protein